MGIDINTDQFYTHLSVGAKCSWREAEPLSDSWNIGNKSFEVIQNGVLNQGRSASRGTLGNIGGQCWFCYGSRGAFGT